jgi:hypothetical protein
MPLHRLFIRPIPYLWFRRAALASKSAALVGALVWFQVGLQKKNPPKVQFQWFYDCGLSRQTLRRGLRELQRAGLVEVLQPAGKKPLITLLECRERSEPMSGAEDTYGAEPQPEGGVH